MEQRIDVKKIVDDFKGVVIEICNEKTVGGIEWTTYLEKGLQLCDSLPVLEHREREWDADFHMLENISIELWNFSVAMKTEGSLVADSHAKMRHIAFKSLEFSGQLSDLENLLKRQIMMGLKAGKAWLECGSAEKADSVLILTEKCIMRLRQLTYQKPSDGTVETSSLEKMKMDIDQDLFTLFCQKLETSVAVHAVDDALKHMMNAKDLLPKFPKEGNYLSMMCYNVGVELYQNKNLDTAVVWLRESYELGKCGHLISAKTQARTLRLLANIYLEIDSDENLQNALNAVSLANKEHCHPAGLFLKLKIMLLQNTEEDIIKIAITDLIKTPELTEDLSVHILQLVSQQKRFQIVPWMIEELLKKFDKCPGIGKLLITNLEVLLQAGMISEAKEFVEYCINAHHSGQPLDFSVKRRFHSVLWEQAALALEREEQQVAVDWYNYSLSIYSKTDPNDMNLAKLHRNRANCYAALQDIEKARKAIEESLQLDPKSVHAHFILYKLSMLDKDPDQGCKSLKTLCELSDKEPANNNNGEDKLTADGLIALAAQHALEHDQIEAALIALQYLSNSSTDEEQVLASLRCLVRLKLAAAESNIHEKYDVESILSHINAGHSILERLHNDRQDHSAMIQTEATWFMKISWNIALECEETPLKMKDLFVLCAKLLCLISQDTGSLSKQLTCMLMSAAACLQINRDTSHSTDKKPILQECLSYLDSCRQIINNLKQQNFGGISDTREKEMELLMMLYEFEAKIKLKDPTVESVLEKALSLSGPDPKTLETLAAIAMEPPVYNRSLCVRALKVAIRKHRQMTQPDVQRCSKLFHSLIELSLNFGSSEDLNGKDEVWNYYQEIQSVIQNCQKGQYPEMEIVWLMTKAWNCGINLFSCSKFSEAEKWCGMSMGMLKHLDNFKSSYESHMSGVYADILSKVEKDDRNELEVL